MWPRASHLASLKLIPCERNGDLKIPGGDFVRIKQNDKVYIAHWAEWLTHGKNWHVLQSFPCVFSFEPHSLLWRQTLLPSSRGWNRLQESYGCHLCYCSWLVVLELEFCFFPPELFFLSGLVDWPCVASQRVFVCLFELEALLSSVSSLPVLLPFGASSLFRGILPQAGLSVPAWRAATRRAIARICDSLELEVYQRH